MLVVFINNLITLTPALSSQWRMCVKFCKHALSLEPAPAIAGVRVKK
jgi:hypothetical protein